MTLFTIVVNFSFYSFIFQKYAEILHKIKRFYFGDGEIDKDSTFKVFNLLSDLNFAYGINKAVKMHANHSISPTYYLRFVL